MDSPYSGSNYANMWGRCLRLTPEVAITLASHGLVLFAGLEIIIQLISRVTLLVSI